MVGPAGFLALWILAATPVSVTFSADRPHNTAVLALLQEDSSAEENALDKKKARDEEDAFDTKEAPLKKKTPPKEDIWDKDDAAAKEDKEDMPAKKTESVKKEAPAKEKTKAEEEMPAKEADSMKEDVPAKEDAKAEEEMPAKEEGKETKSKAKSPSGKALPQDPAYEETAPRKLPRGEGIQGLPPVKEKESTESKETEKPKEVAKPKELTKPTEDAGEVICSDAGGDRSYATECPLEGEASCERSGWLKGVRFEGWLEQGVTINTLSPRNRSNGPVGFNNRSNDYQMNQAYFRMARDVDQECDSWDIGGRVDFLYGTDANYVSARGLEAYDDGTSKWNAEEYGLAMPQVYAEIYTPWFNGMTMKFGHFYSPFGYETAAAPANFFYSHSYAYQYAEPHTLTGLIGEKKFGNFAIQAGMTRGWDSWDDNGNDLEFLCGLSWENSDQTTSVSFGFTNGRESLDGGMTPRTAYSLVVQQKVGENWKYVFQHDYGCQADAGINGSEANWYGINQYLFYTINDAWKAGTRFEWFRDQGGFRIPNADRTADYFELSSGLNWSPYERLMVRPEIRWDWTSTSGCHPFGDGTKSSQILLDCDVVVKF